MVAGQHSLYATACIDTVSNELILKIVNGSGHADERKKILSDISKQEHHISKARKYLLDDKIEFDDFRELKKEHNDI